MQNSYLELEERRRVEVTMMQSSCLEREEERRRGEGKNAKQLLRVRREKKS